MATDGSPYSIVGKTLAYLLPLIQQLYTNPSSLSTSLAPSMREIEGKSSRMLNSKRRQPDIKKVLHPRVLIMAPTAELARYNPLRMFDLVMQTE